MDQDQVKRQFDEAIAHFEETTKKLRTGRASAAMLDSVKVEVYGQMTPLNHIASVKVADAQLLQVVPFDPNNLEAISRAISEDTSLNLNPADDGRIVRVPIPAMTTERRQETVKTLHEMAEEARISFRNIRHDYLNFLKEQLNAKQISQDDKSSQEKQFADVFDKMQSQIETITEAKEREIMTV